LAGIVEISAYFRFSQKLFSNLTVIQRLSRGLQWFVWCYERSSVQIAWLSVANTFLVRNHFTVITDLRYGWSRNDVETSRDQKYDDIMWKSDHSIP